MIKHVSFDFWDTLCIGNPKYIDARVSWLSSEYSVDPNSVRSAIMRVKRDCDSLGIESWTTVPHDTQWLFILYKLGIPTAELHKILEKMTELFCQFPPEIIIDRSTLVRLDNDCISTSITCNTGLASGKMLFDFIADSWLQYYFDFYYWSDERQYFKPNPLVGSFMLEHRHCLATCPEDIIHIGDNCDTDGKLCSKTGMNFVHFSKSKLNYIDIFEHELYPRS